MAELTYIKNLLTTGTGTQGTLLIPRKIYEVLVDEADKALIPRSEAGWVFTAGDIPGSSIELNLLTPNTMDVRIIAEGAEIPMDEAAYTTLNLRPTKYGVAIRITREMLEDGTFNLLQHNIMIAGRRFAENENSLVVTALEAAANTVTGGAAVTIANITRAIQFLHDNDFTPTTYAVGMEVLNDLQNIDTFTEADKLGSREMIERGFVGRLYGMNVTKVSTNAGMTATTSYVYDKKWAYAIAEKRPISIENFEVRTHDMSASAITHRISVTAVRTAAIGRITST